MLVSGGFLFKKYLYMKRVVDWKVWYEELVELLLNSLSPCCKLLYFTSSLQLLTYRILNFTKDGIPDSVQRRIFYNSFRLWQSAAGIDIRECDQCREADILISFVQRRHIDRYPFDGQGGTLAHAFYPLSNKGNNHSRLMSLSFLLVTGSWKDGLWKQPLPDVRTFLTSGRACAEVTNDTCLCSIRLI